MNVLIIEYYDNTYIYLYLSVIVSEPIYLSIACLSMGSTRLSVGCICLSFYPNYIFANLVQQNKIAYQYVLCTFKDLAVL